MEDDNNCDVPIGFIVQPIHNEHKGEKAEKEIDRIDQARLHQITVVVILYKG